MSGAIFGGDEVGAIVLDIGTHTTKVGFAGEDIPKGVFPTDVGYGRVAAPAAPATDGAEAMDTGAEVKSEYIVGSTRLNFPVAGREIRNPLKDGLIEDWDACDAILRHAYTGCVRSESSERPIMVCEQTWNTRDKREKLTELLFEKYNVPSLYLAKNAVLSTFCSGRGTALVVESGASCTSASPVYDGILVTQAVRRSDIAGNTITENFRHLLEKTMGVDIVPANFVASKTPVNEGDAPVWKRKSNLPDLTESYVEYLRNETARDFTTQISRVHTTAFDHRALKAHPTTPYEFPNGYNYSFGLERYIVPEVLFTPQRSKELLKVYNPANASSLDDIPEDMEPNGLKGVCELIKEAISECDEDMQGNLWSNIVLCGGNTLIPGYVERLSNDLRLVCPPGHRLKVISQSSTQERIYSSWVGGSIYASLGSFQQLWVSKEEYKEAGGTILEKRCG